MNDKKNEYVKKETEIKIENEKTTESDLSVDEQIDLFAEIIVELLLSEINKNNRNEQ